MHVLALKVVNNFYYSTGKTDANKNILYLLTEKTDVFL